MNDKKANSMENDQVLQAVPINQRQHWLTPAMIFGGLEFTIPVLMVGATLAGSYGLSEIFFYPYPVSFSDPMGWKCITRVYRSENRTLIIGYCQNKFWVGTSPVYRWFNNFCCFPWLVGCADICCWECDFSNVRC